MTHIQNAPFEYKLPEKTEAKNILVIDGTESGGGGSLCHRIDRQPDLHTDKVFLHKGILRDGSAARRSHHMKKDGSELEGEALLHELRTNGRYKAVVVIGVDAAHKKNGTMVSSVATGFYGDKVPVFNVGEQAVPSDALIAKLSAAVQNKKNLPTAKEALLAGLQAVERIGVQDVITDDYKQDRGARLVIQLDSRERALRLPQVLKQSFSAIGIPEAADARFVATGNKVTVRLPSEVLGDIAGMDNAAFAVELESAIAGRAGKIDGAIVRRQAEKKGPGAGMVRNSQNTRY